MHEQSSTHKLIPLGREIPKKPMLGSKKLSKLYTKNKRPLVGQVLIENQEREVMDENINNLPSPPSRVLQKDENNNGEL